MPEPVFESRNSRSTTPRIDSPEPDAIGTVGTLFHHSPPWDTESGPLFYRHFAGERVPVVEVFRRGAFTDALANALGGTDVDVLCLVDHDTDRLLGRSAARTLHLEEDDVGLAYRVELPDTELGRSVALLVRRGDLFGSSFTFSVAPGGDRIELRRRPSGPVLLRTVSAVSRVKDVGVVVDPAYRNGPQGAASVRSRHGEADPLEAACDAFLASLDSDGRSAELIKRIYRHGA